MIIGSSIVVGSPGNGVGSYKTEVLLTGNFSSSMPSAMLEQEAQMLGLRDKELPFADIGSPQQRHIRDVIGVNFLVLPSYLAYLLALNKQKM